MLIEALVVLIEALVVLIEAPVVLIEAPVVSIEAHDDSLELLLDAIELLVFGHRSMLHASNAISNGILFGNRSDQLAHCIHAGALRLRIERLRRAVTEAVRRPFVHHDARVLV